MVMIKLHGIPGIRSQSYNKNPTAGSDSRQTYRQTGLLTIEPGFAAAPLFASKFSSLRVKPMLRKGWSLHKKTERLTDDPFLRDNEVFLLLCSITTCKLYLFVN